MQSCHLRRVVAAGDGGDAIGYSAVAAAVAAADEATGYSSVDVQIGREREAMRMYCVLQTVLPEHG